MSNTVSESDLNQPSLVDALFKPNAWLARVNFINHLVLFNNVLIAVVAEESGGKSSFIQLLQSNLDDSIKHLCLKASSSFKPQDLLEQMVQAFHLREDAVLTLEGMLEQVNERKAHTLVIIDNALDLSDAFLKEILDALIKQGDSAYFHFCLVGDNAFTSRLNKIGNGDFSQLIYRIEPGSLNESETKAYIQHVLPPSKQLEKAMTASRLKEFFEKTEGNMASINREMKGFFCPDPVKQPRKWQSFVKPAASIAATVMVTGLTLSFLWHPFSKHEEKPIVEHQAEAPVKTVAKIADSNPEPALASHIPSMYLAATSLPVQPLPLKKIVDTLQDEDEEVDANLVVMDKVLVIPKSLQHKPLKTAKYMVSSLVPAPSFSKQEVVKASVNTTKRVTIQIQASFHKEDIQRFLETHRVQEPIKVQIRRAQKSGQVWYVLTVGEYADMEEAKLAMKQLPLSLRQFKPWIRPVSGLTVLS